MTCSTSIRQNNNQKLLCAFPKHQGSLSDVNLPFLFSPLLTQCWSSTSWLHFPDPSLPVNPLKGTIEKGSRNPGPVGEQVTHRLGYQGTGWQVKQRSRATRGRQLGLRTCSVELSVITGTKLAKYTCHQLLQQGDGAGRLRKRLHSLWLCRKGSLSMLCVCGDTFHLHFQAGTDFSC